MAASDLTLSDVLAANAKRHADRPAFVSDESVITHAELWDRSKRLAAGLSAAGVGQGDRIGVLSLNRVEFFLLISAAARLGAMVCGINWRLSAAEVAQVVANDQPRVVVADDELWHLLEPALSVTGRSWKPVVVAGTRVGAVRFEHLESIGEIPAAEVASDDPLLFIHTAWTDGRPRAAMLSHRNLLSQAVQMQAAWKLDEQDVHLCVLPLFHVTAVSLTLATLIAGGCSVLVRKFDAAIVVDAIQAHRATLMGEFAPMLELLLALPGGSARMASLRHLCGMDSPLTIKAFEESCPQARFWVGYGQSETAGIAVLGAYGTAEGSMGWPLPMTRLEIVDDSGVPVPVGQRGEIALRGPCTFLGYWQQAADTAWALRSGRLHTGDAGSLDPQGRLHYQGRLPAKELIKTGGENVYPAEVEAVLRRHPSIAEAVVIGIADATWGESVLAVCVPRGAPPDAKALIDFVGSQIASYKRPRSIVFAESLPLHGDGSHDRAAVRSQYAVRG